MYNDLKIYFLHVALAFFMQTVQPLDFGFDFDCGFDRSPLLIDRILLAPIDRNSRSRNILCSATPSVELMLASQVTLQSPSSCPSSTAIKHFICFGSEWSCLQIMLTRSTASLRLCSPPPRPCSLVAGARPPSSGPPSTGPLFSSCPASRSTW